MLQLGADFMGAVASDRLTMACQDGLDFMEQSVDGCYDVVILDVAALSAEVCLS